MSRLEGVYFGPNQDGRELRNFERACQRLPSPADALAFCRTLIRTMRGRLTAAAVTTPVPGDCPFFPGRIWAVQLELYAGRYDARSPVKGFPAVFARMSVRGGSGNCPWATDDTPRPDANRRFRQENAAGLEAMAAKLVPAVECPEWASVVRVPHTDVLYHNAVDGGCVSVSSSLCLIVCQADVPAEVRGLEVV